MPNMLSQVFRSIGAPPASSLVTKHLPMINSMTASLQSYLYATSQLRKKKYFMAWYKTIPELTALSNKVARDIIYKWHFETVSDTESGRNKIMKANKFAQEVVLRKVMFSQVLDMLITGEAFGWMGKIDESDIKAKLKEIMNDKYSLELKEKVSVMGSIWAEMKEEEGLADTSKIDEDLLRPRKYRSIASSSMEVVYDQYDLRHYVQHVAGRQEIFSLKEVVRFTLMDVDGKVNGFSPIEAIVVQLELLRQMWQNNLSVHKNGGSPDKLFILEDVKPSDPAYERIRQQLEKYKLVENKHGNMLFTGKVSVEDLTQLDQMQFADLGLYITGLVAMQWQIPRSSIPYIMKGANTKEGVGGNSEKGYWRNIEYCQQLFCDTMNTQLWIPHFGVRIVFDLPYVQQDVQLETAKQLKLNNILSVDQILTHDGLQLSEKKRLKMLGLTTMDVEERKLRPGEMMLDDGTIADGAKGMGTEQQPKPNTPTEGQAKKSSIKKQEQNDSAASKGMKPTGTGKESKESYMEVDLDNFIRLYNEDKQMGVTPPRIFQKTSSMITSFKYKSTDFVYKTSILNKYLEEERIRIMNMSGGKIYRL